jgi:hypothetical protein
MAEGGNGHGREASPSDSALVCFFIAPRLPRADSSKNGPRLAAEKKSKHFRYFPQKSVLHAMTGSCTAGNEPQ